MKITLTNILFGAALAMTACAGESNDQPQTLDDRARTDVGADVIPTDTVTEYAAFGKQALEPTITRAASMDVVLNYEGSRAKPAIRGGLMSKPLGAPVLLAEGRPSIRADLPPGVVDLIELLPPSDTKLIVGEPYESPAPDDEYILEQADQERMVLWQQMVNQPTAIVKGAGFTFVRVENRAMNRVYMLDDDGSIRGIDLGEAYVGTTDLVKVPGRGWEVLRFVRFAEVEGADQRPGLSMADARSRQHAAFVVCATRMDSLGVDGLARVHRELQTEVPEFAHCLAN